VTYFIWTKNGIHGYVKKVVITSPLNVRIDSFKWLANIFSTVGVNDINSVNFIAFSVFSVSD
jgi:hypothetical protein